MLILRNEGSSDPEGRAPQRVLGSGGAPATKGPRISEECAQLRVFGSGGVVGPVIVELQIALLVEATGKSSHRG